MGNTKIYFFFCVLLFILSETEGNKSKKLTGLGHVSLLKRRTTHGLTHMDTEENSFQMLGMRNQSTTSGKDVTFKCKIHKRPKYKVQYSWYKNGFPISNNDDHRFVITSRPWGSKLKIKPLYTLDSGVYKCKAVVGKRSYQTSASLSVSFERPPPLNENEFYSIAMPESKCEQYSGVVCKDYLDGKSILVDAFQQQTGMEEELNQALNLFSKTKPVSSRCRKYVLPAFCYFVFPQCDKASGNSQNGRRLCREDCNILKSDICFTEYLKYNNNPFVKALFATANCSHLSSSTNSQCLSLGVAADNHCCYDDDGSNYEGHVHESELGQPCARWPNHMMQKYPELNKAENFCRNPGSMMKKPWCYVGDDFSTKVACNVKQCENLRSSVDLHLILALIGVGIFLLLIGICAFRRRMVSRSNKGFTKLESKNKVKEIPQISDDALHVFMEIGDWHLGKVYQGVIKDDPRFNKEQLVAFKSFDHLQTKTDLKNFYREIRILSQLKHPRITCLKAFSASSNRPCMIFDYTNQVDLKEYLLLNSPCPPKETKLPTCFDKLVRSTFSVDSLVSAALQIASGMEYLTNNNFIHRDLAARNILVCGNLELKISNIGVVKDSYFSSYYKNKKGNLMPIRWMAPESIYSWKFSDKSTVWSFGVLLWEMFSYESQPYCGYSNQEVLKMISHGQLLNCPDQCPAKMYSLMQECWCLQPGNRPSFSKISEQLHKIQKESSMIVVGSFPYSKKNIEDPFFSLPKTENLLLENLRV